MGLRIAIANGNWSNPATWNGGVLPTTGDVVASNNFTVTIDQNINVDSLTNAAATVTTAIPTMTSNTTPSGIASASNITSTTYDAFKAFDANSGTWWGAGTVGVGNPKWLSYEFPVAKAIDKYYIQGVNNGTEQGPKDWEFQGWNGTSWITLHTVTGNTTTYTSPLIGNSTAYIKYRLYVTLGQNTNLGIINLEMYEYLGTTAAVAGGGFTVSTPQTVTCTGGGILGGGPTTVITNTSSGIVNINSPIIYANAVWSINHNATGTLNITSNLTAQTGSNTGGCLVISNTGTVNVVGTITTTAYALCVRVNAAATLNITGDVKMDSGPGGPTTLSVSANNVTINITGNVYGQSLTGTSCQTINLVGSNCVLNITGSIFPVTGSNANNAYVIYTTSTNYIKIIGTLNAPIFGVNPVLISASTSSINILSGPFISGQYGLFPYQCVRMHLIPSVSTYFEFRDETTNGALSPGAIAPATRMVAPASIVDAPAPANVRFGTIYANGSQTGTCKIPATTAVAAGVGVDNTVGSAVLSPGDVWNALVSTMSTSGSIGERLKNASTVQTTGEQLASIN